MPTAVLLDRLHSLGPLRSNAHSEQFLQFGRITGEAESSKEQKKWKSDYSFLNDWGILGYSSSVDYSDFEVILAESQWLPLDSCKFLGNYSYDLTVTNVNISQNTF